MTSLAYANFEAVLIFQYSIFTPLINLFSSRQAISLMTLKRIPCHILEKFV